MGGTRLELSAYLKGITADSPKGAAQSGAISTQFGAADPDLAMLIDRWPTLPEGTRAAVVALVRESA